MIEVLKSFIGEDRIWIYGFGVEGRSTFAFLKAWGYSVSVLDQGLSQEVDGVTQFVGKDSFLDILPTLGPQDLVFRSAGISPSKPELQLLINNGARVSSQLELFHMLVDTPVIAVTGTLGKGTTCSFIKHMFESQGVKVEIGGNFGLAMLDLVHQAKDLDWIILELSSFQLMDFKGNFEISILLRTTSEHLDWHLSQEEYLWAKSNLVRNQQEHQHLIYYSDSENCQTMIQSSLAKRLPFGESVSQTGTPTPQRIIFNKDQSFEYIHDEEGVKETFLLGKTNIIGSHQLQNISAATLAGATIGLNVKKMWSSLKSFVGPKMRLQVVGESQSIRFINDSYATRPDASIAAVQSITEPLALILGGSDKNANFDELVQELLSHNYLVGLFLIGQTAPRLRKIILDNHIDVPIKEFQEFSCALESAKVLLEKQQLRGTLLLSPACASFGMFKNYVDRGQKFNDWVEKTIG